MRALALIADRKLELGRPARAPAARRPARSRSASRRWASIIIDVWGYRGMAFAKRKTAAGRRRRRPRAKSLAVGAGVTRFKAGDPVVMYGALTCGNCKACREGRDNLCENVGGIMGFHVDGFARELINMPERLVIPVPQGRVDARRGLRAHRLLDRAAHAVRQRQAAARRDHPRACRRLRHRHGRDQDGQGHRLHRRSPPSATTTRLEKAKALGADHVINYRKTERFEGDHAQAHQQEGRRRGVRACRRRRLQRLAACASSAAAGSSPAARPRGRRHDST